LQNSNVEQNSDIDDTEHEQKHGEVKPDYSSIINAKLLIPTLDKLLLGSELKYDLTTKSGDKVIIPKDTKITKDMINNFAYSYFASGDYNFHNEMLHLYVNAGVGKVIDELKSNSGNQVHDLILTTLAKLLLGTKLHNEVTTVNGQYVIIPKRKKITKTVLEEFMPYFLNGNYSFNNSNIERFIQEEIEHVAGDIPEEILNKIMKVGAGEDVKPLPVQGKNYVWRHGIWEDGVWNSGTWKDGTWKNGVWEDGIWEDGVWNSGTWENGTWKDGIWDGGTWKNGTWKSGTWVNGIWKDGIWEHGIWKDGIWNGGTWEGGTWEDGIWKDGIWINGTWINGTWVGGVWGGGFIYDPALQETVYSEESPKEYFEGNLKESKNITFEKYFNIRLLKY